MKEYKWHAAYVPEVPRAVDFEKYTMPEFLTMTAEKYPRRTAVVFMGKEISYKDLDDAVNRFANALKGLGVKKGDRVALLMPNIPQIVIAYYALWRLGAVAVPNNPLYTNRELEYQLNDSGATVLITMDVFSPRMLALKPKTALNHIITAHINDYLPFPIKQIFPLAKKEMYVKYRKAPGYHQFLDLIREASPGFTGEPPSWEDTGCIFYTGGTTGISKGVILPHASISSMTQILDAWLFDLVEDEVERNLAVYPFFHLAGFTAVMNLSILNGWVDILVPRPDPKAVLDAMLKFKPTVVPAVPTIYVGMLSLPEFRKKDLSFVKAFFSGAAPLPQETIRSLEEATGATLVEAYGMTEFAIATITPYRGVLKFGSCGVPLPNTIVRIVDLETGEKELPPGEEGEITFQGPQMCSGYYNRPDETEKIIRKGWLYSGDIGKMDEEGYLYIVDRKKDMILSGGYNIYPREIDEVLFEHPKVLEACAVGVPDEYRGEKVKAFIVPKPGEKLTEEELDTHCRERLAAYKIPRVYEFAESLPKSAVGKILRRELRDLEMGKGS